MNLVSRIILVLIFIATQRFELRAQTEKDAVFWMTLNLEKKLSRKFSVQLTEEFRQRDNLRRLNLFYTELGLNWKATDWLKTNISYRWIQKYVPEGYFSYRHRLSFDLSFRKKTGHFAASYRHRLQAEIQDPGRNELGWQAEWYSRSRLEIKYLTDGKLSPFASYEARYQIKDPRLQESNGLWHRNRFALGLQYEIDKWSNISVYYLIQNEFNVSEPAELYVTGIEYSLQW
jgi:hypothetical protein